MLSLMREVNLPGGSRQYSSQEQQRRLHGEGRPLRIKFCLGPSMEFGALVVASTPWNGNGKSRGPKGLSYVF